MDDQLCPTQPHANEHVLLDLVALHVAQAKTEYAADCPIAARLEITRAQRLLDRAFHGEAV